MNENDEFPDVVMPHCPPRNLLCGQKALVTGANSGIGKSAAAPPSFGITQRGTLA